MPDTNSILALEPDDVHILEKQEAEDRGVPLFFAHWHIFLPTLIIAFLYSTAWMVLAFLGKSESGLARLFIVVMSVGVPLLAAHAFLRYQTIRLQISDGHVFCHTGWPRELPVDIPIEAIQKTMLKYGITGKMLGVGTLIIVPKEGDKITITDLANSESAKLLIDAEIRGGRVDDRNLT